MLAAIPGAHGAKALTRSATLNVAAAVSLRCTIATNPLVFGNYNVYGVNTVAPLDATGSISLNCSAGANVDVRLGQGSYPAPGSTNANPRRRLGSGSDRLNYNLYEDAAYTTVWDNVAKGLKGGKTFPVVIPVYGRVPAAQTVPVGVYADSVVATVFF
jgi:spore coat protein U domain-containing protein, fimbrial subunit CupE1/2/3/6